MEEEDHTVSRAKDQTGGQVQRMGELQALLARVQAATGPDRELDAALACALVPNILPAPEVAAGAVWHVSETEGILIAEADTLTASLDAALALAWRVLPGAIRIDLFIFTKSTTAAVWPSEDDECRTTGKTPPLALLAALLRALGADNG